METTMLSKAGALVGEVMNGVDQALPGVAKTSVTTFDTLFWNADGTLTSVAVLIIGAIVVGCAFGLWKLLKRRASRI